MSEDARQLMAFLFNHWQLVFLYSFKFLRDINNKLDTLHTDNKINKNDISHIQHEIIDLKGWIKILEDRIK